MIVAAAGMGFLLAVLWFDLMHDAIAWPYRRQPETMPDDDVAAISRYYKRVTIDAHPMGHLVALIMLVTLTALAVVLVRDWFDAAIAVALVLTAIPIGFAGARIVPDAKRLGHASDDLATRQRLAVRILRGHLFCWVSVFAALLVVLVVA